MKILRTKKIDGANDILKNVNHLQPENICLNENEIKSVKNSRSLEMRLRKKIKVLESHLNNETKSKNKWEKNLKECLTECDFIKVTVIK